MRRVSDDEADAIKKRWYRVTPDSPPMMAFMAAGAITATLSKWGIRWFSLDGNANAIGEDEAGSAFARIIAAHAECGLDDLLADRAEAHALLERVLYEARKQLTPELSESIRDYLKVAKADDR